MYLIALGLHAFFLGHTRTQLLHRLPYWMLPMVLPVRTAGRAAFLVCDKKKPILRFAKKGKCGKKM
jgi:hypothetical protein